MIQSLPDDVLDIVFDMYRNCLRHRLLFRQLRCVMRSYRKCLDSTHPFYTNERRHVILLNTLISAYHGKLLCRLGSRLQALD